jgi:hypothetical protein
MRITFHPSAKSGDFKDRKELAEYAYAQVLKAPFGVKP